MKKDIKERRARTVATLEKQFDNCQELAEKLLSQARENSDYYPICRLRWRCCASAASSVPPFCDWTA